MQLQSSKDVDTDLKDLDLKNIGSVVIAAIKKQETMYQVFWG